MAKRSAKPPSIDPLADVLAVLRATAAPPWVELLEPLLAGWRAQPSAELADVIAHVTAKAKVELPAIRGKSTTARAAWTAQAKRATAATRQPLLDCLADASSKDALARLAIVAKWPPDPRVDDALVRLLETVPYRATSTQPFWTQLFALAEHITDPRAIQRLPGCDAQGVAATMRDWLRVRTQRLIEQLEAREQRELPQYLDEIAAVLGPRKLSIRTQNLEALLGAVYDAPDDDAPRLVLADALLERGDPRGELIALQLAATPDREQKKREKELLAMHGKQWLGELAPVVMAGYRFERGFLAECKVENRHMDRVRKLVGHRAWSTVHTLAGSAAIALHPVMRSLRGLAFTSYEARNHEELPDSWHDLLAGTERPLERLRYSGIASDRHWEDALERGDSVRPGVQGRWVHLPQTSELAALCECRALPKLRELVVADDPELVAEALFASTVIRRLDVFGLVYDARGDRRDPLRWFGKVLVAAPVPTLRLELGSFHQTLVELVRGATGYERLALVVGPATRSNWSEQLVNEAIGILDAMPASLRELRVGVRRNTDPKQVQRLRAAAAQKRLAICEIA